MENKDFTEAAADVLHAAMAAGFVVSPAQLARWHRIGLLSTPWQQPLGQGKGSRTLYPDGTTKQLLALCRLHEHERSLAAIGWGLWVQRFAVADEYWRPMFRGVALSWDNERRRIARAVYPNNARKPSERALKLFVEQAARVANPIFARMRKRVRTRQRSSKDKLVDRAISEDYRAHATDDLEFLVRTIVDVFLGRFQKWPDPKNKYAQSVKGRIVDRAMGIQKARVNQIPRIGPMLAESAAPVLAQLSELFRVPMAKYLDRANDQDIFAARDEWFALSSLFASIGPVMEWAFGKHAFAFRNAGQFLNVDPASQARLILLWHVTRHHVVDGAQVSSILGLDREVAATVGAFGKLRGLAERNREYEQVIQPRRIRGAIRNPRKQAALTAELRALATAETQKT